MTLTTPLVVQEVLDDHKQRLGWAVEGRPADCVKLAIRELLPERPDVLVSGLNAGSNAGINVLYSGTVAAAIEGAFFRITSIACSLEANQAGVHGLSCRRGPGPSGGVPDFGPKKPALGRLFNVNIPDVGRGVQSRGSWVCPQNVAQYEGNLRPAHRSSRPESISGPRREFSCPDPHPDTDVTALEEGYITVTPLQFNLTHEGQLRDMIGWCWKLE